MTRWRTEHITDPKGLIDLSGWWNVQPAAHEIPFLHTAFLQSWISGLMPIDQQPHIQVLFKDGSPAAAAPMVKAKRRLRSMVDQFAPFDLVSTDEPETTEYLPVWLNGSSVAHFYKVRENSALVKQAPLQPRWMVTKTRVTPYVDLSRGIEAIRASTSKEHRRAIQRRTRRLYEIGELQFIDHPESQDISSVLESGLALEAKGWKGARGSAVLRRPEFERWYRILTDIAHQNGWLRLSTLNLDGQMIAFAYDIVYGNRRFGMLSAYDESPEMKPLSCGTILVDRILEQSTADGLLAYEFGHGSREWKRNWTDTEHTVYDISIYGRGFTGRTRFGLRTVRSGIVRTPAGP